MTDSNSTNDSGAAVVITHRVRGDKHPDYERWLEEIAPRCKESPGNLDLHIVRPIPSITDTYTVIIRFDTTEHLKQWMTSAERGRLIAKAKPLLASGDDFYISSGLDFWFTPAGASTTIPVRWKQFLITWSAIYPLVLCVPYALAPLFRFFGIAGFQPATTLVVTAFVVFCMIYIIMPWYTRVVQKWLFK